MKRAIGSNFINEAKIVGLFNQQSLYGVKVIKDMNYGFLTVNKP